MKQRTVCLCFLCCILFLNTMVSAGDVYGTDIIFEDGYVHIQGDGETEFTIIGWGANEVQFDNIDISINGLASDITFVVSYLNEAGDNMSKGERILEFNATYAGGFLTFVFTGNSTNDNMLYNLDVDDIRVKTEVGPHIFSHGQGSWSTKKFTLLCGGYQPDPPYNGSSVYNSTHHSVNLTWSRGNYSDQDVVVGKTNGYPSTPSDGTTWYNGTNLYYNFSVNESQYFTVWSYNLTTNTYSATGLNIPWGIIGITVYNESKPWETVNPFGILISNQDGTDTYQNSSATSVLYLNYVDIPFGVNTIITINASGYRARTYYYDFVVNNFYNLSFYLPPLETEVDPDGGDPGGSGENFSTTRPYTFRVVDQDLYSVANARINVKRYFNTTDTWENVSILVSNGYGEASDDFIPGVLYKIFVSKDGYDSSIHDWEPDPLFYGSNYPIILQIYQSVSISDDIIGFWDIILFNGTLHTHNNSLQVVVIGLHGNITNFQLYVYSLFNDTSTLIGSESSTSQNNIFWYSGVNATRSHRLLLRMNHSELGFVEQELLVGPIHMPVVDADEIEDKITGAVGFFQLGYVNTFLLYIPMIFLLVLPGRTHPGFAIISASMYAGIVSSILASNLFIIAPFICAVGITLIIVKQGMVKL